MSDVADGAQFPLASKRFTFRHHDCMGPGIIGQLTSLEPEARGKGAGHHGDDDEKEGGGKSEPL
jgi:hypothetical protein